MAEYCGIGAKKKEYECKSLEYDPSQKRLNYARCFNNNERELAKSLAQSYGVSDAYITTSGTQALDVIFRTILEPTDTLLLGTEMFCTSIKNAKWFHQKGLIKDLIEFEIGSTTMDQLEQLLIKSGQGRNVILIESCTNPTGRIINFESFHQLRLKFRDLILIVDNTWLTPSILNPFDAKIGADIVFESLAKYNSFGTTIAGAILCKDESVSQRIGETIKLSGIHLYPDATESILFHHQSMNQRIQLLSQPIADLAQRLEKHEKVLSVSHPSLTSHPNHELAVKHFVKDMWPSVLVFSMKARSKNYLLKEFESNDLFVATSYGGSLSRIDPFFYVDSGSKVVQLRVALGVNDYSTFIDKLFHFLDHYTFTLAPPPSQKKRR